MRADSALKGPSFVLTAISTLMLQLALFERQGGITAGDWCHLGLALLISTAIGVNSGKKVRLITTACFALLVILPFAWGAFQRFMALGGQPFEILLALMLRNMTLGLVAQRADVRSQRFASLGSSFLAMFSILWFMNRWTIVLLFVYTIVGMWWLLGDYWDRLSGCFLTHSERNVPWKPLCAAAALSVVGGLLLLPLATGGHLTTAVNGFVPSSGGTLWQDEYAYGGVGDGPQMVSAKENASGFGPIESELFLESKMPSLYDCFNDMSDAPPRPRKKGRQRAIPLAPSMMQQNHQKRGTNQQPGREFNTVRKRKTKPSKVSDLRSHSLLQVAGRVPLHLGLQTYDLWDGCTLASSNSAQLRELYLDTSAKERRPWVRFDGETENELLAHRGHHELRIINLKTDRVPLPPNTIGVHVDKLHTETLFKCTADGMLALDMKFIPQLTVMHVESLQRSPDDLPPLLLSSSNTIEDSDRIGTLAHKWTMGINEDWKKVEAICGHLRQEYVLDSEHMVPPDTDDAAIHFLFESRCGPDYLFATSAALLIRTLGYESRVVSGFYVNPEHYDRQSRLTSVYSDDAHFWVEVLASSSGRLVPGDSRWVPLEPSPGYQVLLAPQTLWSHLFSNAVLTWNVIKRNPLPVLASLLVCSIAWTKRAAACDLFFTSWWRIHHRWGDARHQVNSTLRLLSRRAYVRGFTRTKGAPLGHWLLADEVNPDSCLTTFVDLANWALYGEGIPLAYSSQEANSVCRAVAAVAYRPMRNSEFRTHLQSEPGTA